MPDSDASSNPRRIGFLVSGKCESTRLGPCNDVKNLASLLNDETLGKCQCRVLQDCPDEETYLSELKQVLQDWNTLDQLILYYAGHGKTDRRINEWCLVFGEHQESELIFGWILAKLRKAGVTRAIIILDACYAGEAIDFSRSMDAELFKDLPKGMAFIASAGRLEKAYDSPDQSGGVFTNLLCEAISTGLRKEASYGGVIGVQDLINYFRKHRSEHNLNQEPHYSIQYAADSIWIARNRSGGKRQAVDEPHSIEASTKTSEEWSFIASNTDHLDKPCDFATLEDLDWDLIREFSEVAGAPWLEGAPIDEQAKSLRLVARLPSAVDSPPKINAVLCFAKRPDDFLEGAECRLFFSELSEIQLSSKTITGPLSHPVTEATNAVVHSLNDIDDFSSGPRRHVQKEFPKELVREIISNALMHRDYTSSASVDIHLTDSALTIVNPGTFPDKVSWDDFLEDAIPSQPRNPKLVRFMKSMGVFEKYGRGFQIFRDYMQIHGTDSIRFQSIPGPFVRVIVRRPKLEGHTRPKRHLFLSYCAANSEEVSQLRDDLLRAGEQVWWDKDILPGQDWKLALRKAMSDCYAIVMCFSTESQSRSKNGVYPEAIDAIAAIREASQKSLLLIPVRLSECEIPALEIDSERSLGGLRYVDLFPAVSRIDGLNRLIEAARNAPGHPPIDPSTHPLVFQPGSAPKSLRANPGGSLAPNAIFGRDQTVRELWNTLDRQSIVLTAERRIGKTSILRKMLNTPPIDWIGVYRDLEGCHTPQEFASLVYEDVNRVLQRSDNLPKKANAFLRSVVGTEVAKPRDIPANQSEAWKLVIEKSIEDLAQLPRQQRCLFIWDELPYMLQNFSKREGENAALQVMDLLRAMRQRYPYFRMIVTGSIGMHHVLDGLRESGHLNAPINDMYHFYLGPLERDAATELSRQLIQGELLESNDQDAAAERIAVLADGIPFYIHHCVETLRMKGVPANIDQIEACFEEALTDANDPWHLDHFRLRLSQYYPECEGVVLAILDYLAASENAARIDELSQFASSQPTTESRRQTIDVLRMMERDHYIVREKNGNYRFRFALLKRWWKIHRGL